MHHVGHPQHAADPAVCEDAIGLFQFPTSPRYRRSARRYFCRIGSLGPILNCVSSVSSPTSNIIDLSPVNTASQCAIHNSVRGFHPSGLVLPQRKSSIFFKLPSYCITQSGLRRVHSSIIAFWLSIPPIIIGNDVLSWAASSSSKITTSKQLCS